MSHPELTPPPEPTPNKYMPGDVFVPAANAWVEWWAVIAPEMSALADWMEALGEWMGEEGAASEAHINDPDAHKGQKRSVELDGEDIQLVGDVDSPGVNKVYGTNAAGARGWKDDSAGGGSRYHIPSDETLTVPAGHNLLIVDTGLTLDGDLILDGDLVEMS
ncbi:MAG: hypothetical protein ACPHN2_08595 [Sinimarinibacterium flocculans]|uniref:hypothetical protein n=1 Tax=Sinimarinibacterium flocculans TaxID=985250 RepID=UPI003C433755